MTQNVLFVLNHTQRIESASLDTLLAKARKDGLVPLNYSDEIVRIGNGSKPTVFSDEYKLPAVHLRMQEDMEKSREKPWGSCEYDAIILKGISEKENFTIYFGYNLRYNVRSVS